MLGKRRERMTQSPLVLDDVAKTGVAGLDEVLAGGFPRNRTYLLQGDPGVGKTTLALSFLLTGAAVGERCVYITLSETRDEIEATARSHGWSLDDITVIELSALEQTAVLEQDNTLFESSEVELQETTHRLLEYIAQREPQRVVIDSLSELRLMAQSSLRYRRQILGFKQYFSGKQCTVLFLDDRTSEPGDMQLQSLAHGVVHMEQIPPMYGEDRRRVRVVKLRGLRFRGGYHDFVIRTGGLVVFPRLIAAEHHSEFQTTPLSSSVPALDRLLGGGLDRGTSTLAIGPAGVGKSVLATQFAMAAAKRGESAAIFAFDEVTRTFFERSRALGMNLDEHVRDKRIVVRQIDTAEMGPGEFAHLARAAVDNGARLLVIDSLNGYLSAMPDQKMLVSQLHELLSFFAQRGVATLLIIGQGGLFGHVRSPIDVSYLSDTVIMLRYFEAAGRVRKAISVVKKRLGPHENTIHELAIGQGGLCVGEPLLNFSGILAGGPQFLGETHSLVSTS
jgi:circadian clock protein KaiC